MSQAVHKSIYEDLVLDNLSPSVKGEICSDDSGLRVRSEREMIEEQLTSFFVTSHVSKLIADDKVVALKAGFESM